MKEKLKKAVEIAERIIIVLAAIVTILGYFKG